MDVIPLLISLFVVPGANALNPVDVVTDGPVMYVDSSVGTGRMPATGDIATIHFTLKLDGGKELANTSARGLPYSFQLQGTEFGSPLVEALQGMRVGGERLMLLPGDQMPVSDDPLVLKDAVLVLDVRLIGVRKVATAPSR